MWFKICLTSVEFIQRCILIFIKKFYYFFKNFFNLKKDIINILSGNVL